MDTTYFETILCADVKRQSATALIVPASTVWASSASSCKRPGSFSRSFLFLLLLLVAVFTPTAFADIQHVYDENGRLV